MKHSLSPNFGNVCAVARRLRYRTLERVLKEKVRIGSEASVVEDVLEALDRFLPPEPRLRFGAREGLPEVAKYALLDLEFALPPRAGAGLPRLSRQALRDLDVLVRLDAGADTCLDTLLEEVSAGCFVLKVILDAVQDDRSVSERIRHSSSGLPRGYFPRAFRVRDACITNAPSLWLHRHFYL